MKKLLTVLLSLVIVLGMLPTAAFAAAGDVPSHDKVLKLNDDGTFTLALNVTGDAEKQIQKVNVIVIVDRSGSMNEQSGTGAYVASNTNGATMYGYIDGEYRLLERSGGGFGQPVTYSYEGTVYTGQRYIYDNTATRLQATQAAVNGLANTLLSYNGKDDNPDDTVEMALVSFSTNATTNVSKTSDATTFTNAVNGLTQGGGTNWEAALQEANDVDFGDSDPTYVIFFSDGAPTFHASNGGYNNWNNQYGVYGTGQEQEPNMERSYTQATDDAAALATKVGTDRFYTIFAYGTNVGAGYMTDLTEAAGAPAANNYSASNTVELEEAFAAILEAIEMAGIGAVSMDDGTTSNVTLQADPDSSANLLTIDESSYKYYRAGGDYSDIADYDPENGEYGAEWADAPEAKLQNGSVKWDLSSEGVLENGVTYTVTFDCWPSQTTLDIVADIKNDPDSYDKLDANIKKYIDKDGNLKTNTTASLSYTDTRTGESNTENFVNPDPVSTTAVEELAITKEWENPLDGQAAKELTLSVTRDGDPKYEMVLNEGNKWTDTVFISIGIIRGTEVLETGHDFTFTEPADLGYYWELDVPTVRPMLIDGTLTMLILKDEKHDNPDNAKEYEVDGKTYYVGETGEASLNAVNHRRSRLNITKAVDGADADPAQKFPFTINVVDSKAADGSEDNLNSDYWVWFSVWNGGAVDAVVSGADKEMDAETGEWTGYYYAPSGSDIEVELKAGDNLRFLNLPSGSTYTITEGTEPDNYAFTSAELTDGEDDGFSGDQTTTGTIVETSTDYTVTFTNTYALTDIEITKQWDDSDDQDGYRPSADEFKEWLTLNAGSEDVTEANADKLEITDNEDGTYTVKWTGLDRFKEGEEIEYTVTETPSDKYTAEGSPASDGDTITNSHTTETVNVSVEKKWIGPEGDAVTVTLYADEKATDNSLTLNADNSWKGTFENLPKKAGGKDIEYSVVEDGVTGVDAEKYESEISGSAEDGFVITNTDIETIDVKVRKVWEDESNRDGIRPDSLTLTLNGAPEGTEIPDPTVVKSADNNTWTYTWKGVPKYDPKTGEEVEYSVSEDRIPEGYECEETTAEPDGTITNTHEIETVDVTVTKKWEDDSDRDEMRPEELALTLNNVPEGHDAPEAEVEKDGNTWTYTWTDVPKNASGKEIKYTVTEETVPTGYTCEETTVDAGGTITNSHKIGTTTVEVTKKWVDESDKYKVRPGDLTLTLHGVPEGYDTPDPEITKNGDSWTYRWSDVPKMENGEDIVYTVTEDEVPVGYVLDPVDPVKNGETITNTFKPVFGDPPVKKELKGDEPAKAENFTFKLTAVSTNAEGLSGKMPMPEAANGAQEMTMEVAAGETKEFGEFPLVKPGKYTYTIEEVPGDTEGYTYSDEKHTIVYDVTLAEDNSLQCVKSVDGVEISGEETDDANVSKFTFTNEYTKPVVSVKVSKVWEDNNNEDLTRPDSITVKLYADGKDTGKTLELSKANEWTGTFEELDKYDADGNAIKYTVDEAKVPEGYSAVVSGDMEKGFTITNSVVPPTGDTSDVFLWSGLSLASLLGLGYLFLKRRREEQ